jgi:hypothetical protein
VSPKVFFKGQLQLIRTAFINDNILLSDFKLLFNKQGAHDCGFKNYFTEMDRMLSDINIVQLVKFNTWSRTINDIFKASLLDHVYSNNPEEVTNLHCIDQLCGNHSLIVLTVNSQKPLTSFYYKIDWSKYKKEILCDQFSNVDWRSNADEVQLCWKDFENKLLEVVDHLAPLKQYFGKICNKKSLPQNIKNTINLIKRLLKAFRLTGNVTTKSRTQVINKSIRSYYNSIQSNKVRKTVIPGNTLSLCQAARLKKDPNMERCCFENELK